MDKLNLVDNSISHILFKNTRMLFYDKGNDGLIIDWNSLSPHSVDSPSIDTFRARITRN